MRRHADQPNQCVALGIRQDRLVAKVSVHEAKLRTRGGSFTRSGSTYGRARISCWARTAPATLPNSGARMCLSGPVAKGMRSEALSEALGRGLTSR